MVVSMIDRGLSKQIADALYRISDEIEKGAEDILIFARHKPRVHSGYESRGLALRLGEGSVSFYEATSGVAKLVGRLDGTSTRENPLFEVPLGRADWERYDDGVIIGGEDPTKNGSKLKQTITLNRSGRFESNDKGWEYLANVLDAYTPSNEPNHNPNIIAGGWERYRQELLRSPKKWSELDTAEKRRFVVDLVTYIEKRFSPEQKNHRFRFNGVRL